ncbi:glyoxalase II [Trypanosoma brucei equiperdum]|uniref:hydroxyacylglutathione hydrolase n=1 Tax=Trypanosoma brucei equiperdum TaxID=630700 RepID=A0A3L6L905_9TRYP|nr:glyoxalase II [Trypanosoma brucei equiperdum]
MMESVKQFVGPSLMVAVIIFLYVTSIASATQLVIGTAAACLLGLIPANAYFPPVWFRLNLFVCLYNLYCSELVGYRWLRFLIHKRYSVPHSDYRHGVRCLSGNIITRCPFPPHVLKGSEFHTRGGGTVDLKHLGEKCREGCYDGVFVMPVPVLLDNYAYFILSCKTKRCAVVDPADPTLVLNMLEVVRNLTQIDFMITDILTTHKHWDHAGGNMEMRALSQCSSERCRALLSPELNIYGSEVDRPHACNKLIKGSDELIVAGGGAKVVVLSTPGHTGGSVMFLVGDALPKEGEPQRLALFTGDCVFCGGCGALFEATSVDETLETVDIFNNNRTWVHPATGDIIHTDDVLIYVGHEYTERSLDMILSVQRTANQTGEQSAIATSNYCDTVAQARNGARRLRSCVVADDVYMKVTSMETKAPLHLRACTVPSTVTIEKKVNALLSLKRCVLEEFQGKPYASMAVQRAIYTSTKRNDRG